MKIKLFKYTMIGVLLSIISMYFTIDISSSNDVYDKVELIPENKVGLVLGTSKLLQNGYVNLYFKYRIDATVILFQNNKIEYILISGDNGTVDYDEPTDFKNELIKRGIPEDKIYLDYAGFRTLDSVIRSSKVFGQNSITIISQEFHNKRAVFLAKVKGINAIGYNAKDVNMKYGFKVYLREVFARTKVFIDIIFHIKPKFLGEQIIIK